MLSPRPLPVQVSFGIFDTEDEAARQYDRALVLEKGRTAKTNFPIRDYEAEVAAYEAYVIERWVCLCVGGLELGLGWL